MPPSRVSNIHAMDLESGEEFERIKQNFRSTVVEPDVTALGVLADFPETQAAFEELQFELQEFLAQHVSKVSALQGRMESNAAAQAGTLNGEARARVSQGTVTPVSISRRPSATASTHSHVVPEGAISEKSGDPSQRPVVQIANNPLEIHMAALQTFLTTHLENIRVLQNSVPPIVDGRRAAGKADQANKATRALGGQEEEVYATLAQQFHMRVVISTFTAALIVLLLVLVDGIIGPRRRMAFSVGMLFSFMALSIHFANIFLAGRGATLTATTTSGPNRDIESLKFYLSICGNLHLASTALFLVSIAVMIFLIFSSIAFPLVLLFLSGIGALGVFVSAYWEIPITLANVQFLAANLGRLRSSLDSLRRGARAARLRPSKTV